MVLVGLEKPRLTFLRQFPLVRLLQDCGVRDSYSQIWQKELILLAAEAQKNSRIRDSQLCLHSHRYPISGPTPYQSMS